MHGVTKATITNVRWKMQCGFWSGFASSGFSVGTKGYGGVIGRRTIMGMLVVQYQK